MDVRVMYRKSDSATQFTLRNEYAAQRILWGLEDKHAEAALYS